MAPGLDLSAIGIILLASGSSERMGENKLLLPIEGQSCIYKVGEMISQLKVGCVVALYKEDTVRDQLAGFNFRLIYNPRAHLGQSEAIKLGVSQMWDESIKAWAFVMGDQPLLNEDVCKMLFEAFLKSDSNIAVPCVGDVTYSPVVFHRDWRDPLLSLEGDCGAKRLLKLPEARVLRVMFQETEPFEDMDTAAAYQSIQDRVKKRIVGG
jgi:molybdenum cofactor cytidylyltransferase